jgi:CTP:molybdopterin cytidylyltransferase MocA
LIGAIVLAAGASRRFGDEPKQLAPLGGTPLLEHALAALAGVDPRVVVLGHAAEEIAAGVDLHGARPVVCADWERGQAASLRCGIAALGDVDAALVVLGDQPGLTPAAVAAVIAARPTARAAYDGRPGHPVLLGRALLDRAGELTGDEGFRALLDGARTVEVGHLADPADIDTREELARR